jgi:putative PIN family toxin of toxin-antitoxin system
VIRKQICPKVFFNASVVLAGLRSPRGGSGKLLKWSKQKKIKAIISEIILDEIRRNLEKIGLSKKTLSKILRLPDKIIPAPKASSTSVFNDKIVDYGDAHVFASAREAKADFLVSLDKKHILSLKGKIKKIKIVNPEGLIKALS